MEKVLETLLKDTGGSQKLEQVHKSARCFFVVKISSPWLCNEEGGGNDDYSDYLRLGLDFLESYSRAPATDYRKQVTPCHVKEGCEKIRNKKQQQKLPKEKKHICNKKCNKSNRNIPGLEGKELLNKYSC